MAGNEYDALAMAPTDPLPAKPSNEYDGIIVDLDRERNQRTRATLNGAMAANPDQAARAVTLSRQTGLPADMVERNLPAIEGEQRLNEYDEIIKGAPKLGAWLLTDPINAKVAKDDYANLGLLERLWNEVKRPIYGNRAGVQAMGAEVALRSLRELDEAEAKAQRGEYLTPLDKARIAQAPEVRRNAATITQSGIEGVVENRAKAAALPMRPAMRELQEAQGWEQTFKAIGKDPLGLIFDLTAQSLPQLAVGVGAAAVGGPVAGVAAGGLTSFGTEFVSGILDNLQGAGIDINDPMALQMALGNPDLMRNAYQNAAIKAAVIASVDAASMGVAGKTLAPARLAAKPVQREAVNIVAQSLVQAGAGGGGEALGSVAVGEEVKPNAVLMEVLGGLGTMPAEVVTMRHAMREGAALAGRAADVSADQAAAEAGMMALDTLMQQAGASGLAQRSPEKFAEFMQSLSEGGDAVYVPAARMREFLQGLDPAAASSLTDAFEITDQILEAEAIGGDVVIPLGKYVAAGSEAHAALRADLRVTPDGVSFNEARAQAAEREAQLELDAAAWRESLEAGEEAATPGQQVYNDVFKQAREAGYTIDAASQYAALYAARYQTRAERMGSSDAWTIYQQTPLTIRQDLPDSIRYAEPGQIDVLLNSIRSGKDPVIPKDTAPTLLEWLSRRGGALDAGGELKARDLGRWHLNTKGRPIRGRNPLIVDPGTVGQTSMLGGPSDGGPRRGLDDVTLAAWEAGFFPEHVERPSIDDFLAAVDEEQRGRPRRSEDAPYDPREDFRRARAELDETLNRLGLDVAKMRNRAIKEALANLDKVSEEGQGYYEQSARGSIRFGDGRAMISLFRARDLSTLLHETGHLWLEEMRADAVTPGAPKQIVDDFTAILEAIGAKDGSIEVEHHERFARMIETYFMEGKPPSEGLRSAFASFKRWLVSIYRNLMSLDAPVSDELRAIFDRMIATDEEIAAAREQQGLNPIFADAKAAGMTEAEFAAYTEAARKAMDQSVDQAVNRAMADIRRRETKAWKEEAKATREAVTREVMTAPGQAALYFLRTGKFWEGDTPEGLRGLKLDKADLLDIFGDETALKMLPANVYRETGGASADSLGEALGFSSGRAMVESLMAIEQQRRDLRAQGDKRSVVRYLVETETERRMTERHGDALKDGSIEREAMEAVRNDRLGLVMSTELKALSRQTGGAVPASWAEIKAWAAQTMADKRVKDAADFGRYIKAERNAGREVQRALLAGDKVVAFKAKQDQMINAALAMEAKRIAQERDAAVKMFDRYASAKTLKSMEQSYLDQIHGLLEKFDFKRATEKELNRRADFAEWAIQQQGEGVDIAATSALMRKAALTHYTDMTVDEMRGLSDTVKQVAHLGRMKKTLQVANEQREFDAVVEEAVSAVSSLRQLDPAEARNPGVAGVGVPDKLRGWWDRTKAGARSLDAGLLKMEQVFDWLDAKGGGAKGAFNSVVFRPIAEAQQLEARLQKEVTQKIIKLNRDLPKGTARDWNTRHSIPELIDGKTGRASSMLKSEVVAIALNMGNASNRDKLLRGEKWSEDAVKVVLDRMMTKADWDYVQGVWDAINDLWPHVEAMEKAVNGVAPEKVEAQSVVTPHGTYRGGYYPVIYDPNRAGDVADRAARNADRLFENTYTRAATSRGFTNERVEGYARPLHLSLDVIPRHVSEVVHDIAFREPIRQADKFLGDKRIREAVEGALGREVYQQFRPWLQNIANEWAMDRRGLGFWENLARGARTSASVVGMGLRMTTMLAQVSGLSDAAEAIGPKWVMRGLGAFVGDPLRMRQTRDFVFAKSEEMRNRMNTTERDVRDALRKLTGKAGLVADARRFAFYGIGIMDLAVTLPTWMGAYRKGLSEGMSDGDAVYYADKAVRSSQGAGGAKDLAAVQRGNEFQKLAVMFYSYFNHLYNRQRDIGRSARDASSAGDFAMILARSFFLMVVPAILGNLISGQGPKEDEDWGAWAARKIGANMFAGVPVLRDAVNLVERKWSGEFASYQATPAARAVDVIERTASDAFKGLGLKEGEVSDRWIRNALETSGYVFGLPTGQVGATTQFLWDTASGRQDPETISDWFKGLIYGKFEDDR